MSCIRLTTLIALPWCLASTYAITCEPGYRYSHPLNCSAFIICDVDSNPNTFECPDGLHFNSEKSYCDWPARAKCEPEFQSDEEEDTTGGHSSSTGAGEGIVNMLDTMKSVIESMNADNGTWDDTIAVKDTTAEVEDSKDEVGDEGPKMEEQPNVEEEPQTEDKEGGHTVDSEEDTGDAFEAENMSEVAEDKTHLEGDAKDSTSEDSSNSEVEGNEDNLENESEESHSDGNVSDQETPKTDHISEEEIHDLSKRQIIETEINQDTVNEDEVFGDNENPDVEPLGEEEGKNETPKMSNSTFDGDINSNGGESNFTTSVKDDLNEENNLTTFFPINEGVQVEENADGNGGDKYAPFINYLNLKNHSDILGYEISVDDISQTNTSIPVEEKRVRRNTDHCKSGKCV